MVPHMSMPRALLLPLPLPASKFAFGRRGFPWAQGSAPPLPSPWPPLPHCSTLLVMLSPLSMHMPLFLLVSNPLRHLLLIPSLLPPPATPIAPPGGREPPRAFLDAVNRLSYAAETVFHGTPSGIDNAVATYGGGVSFKKCVAGAANADGSPCAKSTIKLLTVKGTPLSKLRLLITNTNVPRSTRELVAKVRRHLEAQPAITAALFAAIEAVVQRFLATLDNMRNISQAKNAVIPDSLDGGAGSILQAEMRRLVVVNHSLLVALGVSHPKLEHVRRTAMELAGLPTKLTGAGGGGCAMSVLPLSDEDDASAKQQLEALRMELECQGYTCTSTAIGGPGVLLHTERPYGTR